MLNAEDEGWGWVEVGGSENLERVRRALGEEVASVEHGRTHNLHGNSLIFLSVAVRPAEHMVAEWTGCADDQRWGGELEKGGGGLDQRQWSVPPISAPSPTLSPPYTLPSADPKSCFDWISHELMRQA